VADRYWNAARGSHNDGGAIHFSTCKKIRPAKSGSLARIIRQTRPAARRNRDLRFFQRKSFGCRPGEKLAVSSTRNWPAGNSLAAFEWVRGQLSQWTFDEFRAVCREIAGQAKDPPRRRGHRGPDAAQRPALFHRRERRSPFAPGVHAEMNRLFGSLPARHERFQGRFTGS